MTAVFTDSHRLGDKLPPKKQCLRCKYDREMEFYLPGYNLCKLCLALDPHTSVAALKEDTAAQLEARKMPGQKELESHERSAGPRVPFGQLIQRLQRLNPSLRAIDGSPGSIALYSLRRPYERDPEPSPKGEFFDDHKYVGGFPREALPEYSHITLDERGLPKREIRGWRSVLMTLIKAGVIAYQDAVEEFGEAYGPRSHRWHEQMRPYKY
jgi:hypothetical protein